MTRARVVTGGTTTSLTLRLQRRHRSRRGRYCWSPQAGQRSTSRFCGISSMRSGLPTAPTPGSLSCSIVSILSRPSTSALYLIKSDRRFTCPAKPLSLTANEVNPRTWTLASFAPVSPGIPHPIEDFVVTFVTLESAVFVIVTLAQRTTRPHAPDFNTHVIPPVSCCRGSIASAFAS